MERPTGESMARLRNAIDFCASNNVKRLVVTTRTISKTVTVFNVEVHFWLASLYSYAVGYIIINSRIRALEALSSVAAT